MMLSILVDDKTIQLDEHGFVKNLTEWNVEVAVVLAERESVVLTDAHFEIIKLLRIFYKTYEISPSQRPFVKYVAQTLGKEKGKSIYLMTLFGSSPAKIAAKIAGLPKPSHCF